MNNQKPMPKSAPITHQALENYYKNQHESRYRAMPIGVPINFEALKNYHEGCFIPDDGTVGVFSFFLFFRIFF